MIPRLRFLHIAKTAGTSLSGALATLYPGSTFAFTGNLENDRERFAALPEGFRAALVFIHGHAPLETGIPLVDTFPTVTFLREPVARVRSFCQHVAEGKSPHLVERFPPNAFDLGKFLESKDPELHNLQCRCLLGDKALNDAPSPREAAAGALEKLKGMTGFGLVEEFDLSLFLMKKRCSWNALPFVPRLNTKSVSNQLSFSDSNTKTIRWLNQADLLLYEKAVQLFHERTASLGPCLKVKLAMEKARTRLLHRITYSRLGRFLPKSARFQCN